MGRGILYGTLGNGGTAYFAAKSDLSTLLEDLELVRPTELNFVPAHLGDPVRRIPAPGRAAAVRRATDRADRRGRGPGRAAAVPAGRAVHLRDDRLGPHLPGIERPGSSPCSRCICWTATAPPRPAWCLFDGEMQRPPVIDYKLVDVPDLGYFSTDRPHPRGELLLRTENMFPGYYKRPEITANVFDDDGYYRTGDVVRRGRARPAGVRRPPQQRAEARAGRVRHPREAGGGVRQQPAGPPDLRLRQQRASLPAGGRGADRRGAGRLATSRRSSR